MAMPMTQVEAFIRQARHGLAGRLGDQQETVENLLRFRRRPSAQWANRAIVIPLS
jgi:hypothetical protein